MVPLLPPFYCIEVVIAAKGQAMHVSYSLERPLVLFGSEAAAIAVGVTADYAPLEHTLALGASQRTHSAPRIVLRDQPSAYYYY
jgi:hypothetical protein